MFVPGRAWRVTTDDEQSASTVASLFGGTAEAADTGFQVSTEAAEVAVVLARGWLGATEVSRGESGAVEPRVAISFRLAQQPDLGVFEFSSGAWGFGDDLTSVGEDALTEMLDRGEVAATLALEPSEFVAQSGPFAGQRMTYAKPVLRVDDDA